MGNTSRFRAMNNTGDYVLLLTSKKKVVQSLTWGKPDENLPKGVSTPPKVSADPGGSAVRVPGDEPFASHKSEYSERFSPGEQAQ